MLLRKLILNALYYSGSQALAAPLLGGSGTVLMLHHVRDMPDAAFSPNRHLSISPGFLDQMLGTLAAKHEFVSMDALAWRLKNGKRSKSKKPFLAITLDDGYRDNIRNAVPVFQKHNVPYMIYLAPGMIEGNANIWWEDLEYAIAALDRFYVDLPSGRQHFDVSDISGKQKVYAELSNYLFFDAREDQQRSIVRQLCASAGFDDTAHLKAEVATWRELKELAADPLCSYGAHTIGHNLLSKLDQEEARHEMQRSREIIKARTGRRVQHLAYPYGFPKAAGPREFELAAELKFMTAVTTRKGVVYPEHAAHMTALPRISVNGHLQSLHYIKTLISGLPTWLHNAGRKLDVGENTGPFRIDQAQDR